MTRLDVQFIESHYLLISSNRTAVEIRFVPEAHLTMGSTQRLRQAIRIVRSTIKRNRSCEVQQSNDGLTIRIASEETLELRDAVQLTNRKLDELAKSPLTTSMVEEILQISAHERIRWTKDGRLRNCGRTSFRRGNSRVSLYQYSPRVIAELAEHPEVVRAWRSEGAAGDSLQEHLS